MCVSVIKLGLCLCRLGSEYPWWIQKIFVSEKFECLEWNLKKINLFKRVHLFLKYFIIILIFTFFHSKTVTLNLFFLPVLSWETVQRFVFVLKGTKEKPHCICFAIPCYELILNGKNKFGLKNIITRVILSV